MRSALLAFAVALLPACATAQDGPAGEGERITVTSTHLENRNPPALVRNQLDRANAAFSSSWMAGDVDALLDAYTVDAIVHPPAGGVLTTREQIRGFWAPITNQQRVGHRIEPTIRYALGDERVLEMGRWHTSRTVDGQSPWVSGCYTVVWRRVRDVWRMEYDAWTAPNEHSWACRPR